jgi:5-methylcytosine-specific restriction endonuclease McrA
MPAWDDDTINDVYDKNEGYCWHCGKRLAFTNYGYAGAKGAWEIDHSVPLAQGGTNRFSNLVPACIPCNRSKQDLSSRQFSG